MLKDVGVEMKVKSLDSAGWGEAVNNADNPPASWGFEWLWSSPVDLLIFFHAYPSDAYNGSLPEIKAAVEAWQTAADDAGLRGRREPVPAGLGREAAEDLPAHDQQHLGRAEERHGLHAARVQPVPAVQRRLARRVA